MRAVIHAPCSPGPAPCSCPAPCSLLPAPCSLLPAPCSLLPAPMQIGPLVIDPPLLQAPMAGFTNYAFRQIVRRHGGVGLPATEMFSARGFLEIDSRHDRPPERLWGVLDEPRPLAAQIWDNDPMLMAEVGRRLAREFRVSVVDINFGCPVSDVTEKAHSGSYLLRYPDRVGQIVAAVAKACAPTPVTAKIRLGACRDAINACDVAQAVEDAGGAALTVHGRTAADMFRGSADWEQISRDQALPDPHSPDRQRRHHHAAGRGRGLPPLRHRRRDDRPGGAQSALALSPGPGRIARRADPARSQPGRATRHAARALPSS